MPRKWLLFLGGIYFRICRVLGTGHALTFRGWNHRRRVDQRRSTGHWRTRLHFDASWQWHARKLHDNNGQRRAVHRRTPKGGTYHVLAINEAEGYFHLSSEHALPSNDA
jgi:hypothetical protein